MIKTYQQWINEEIENDTTIALEFILKFILSGLNSERTGTYNQG